MCLFRLNGSISTIQSMLPSNKSSVGAKQGIMLLLLLFASILHPVWANKCETVRGAPVSFGGTIDPIVRPVSWKLSATCTRNPRKFFFFLFDKFVFVTLTLVNYLHPYLFARLHHYNPRNPTKTPAT